MHFKQRIGYRRQLVGYGTGTDRFEGCFDRFVRFGARLTRFTATARLDFTFGLSRRFGSGNLRRNAFNRRFRRRLECFNRFNGNGLRFVFLGSGNGFLLDGGHRCGVLGGHFFAARLAATAGTAFFAAGFFSGDH